MRGGRKYLDSPNYTSDCLRSWHQLRDFLEAVSIQFRYRRPKEPVSVMGRKIRLDPF